MLPLFAAFGLASCADSYHIEGFSNIPSLDGKMVYLRMMDLDGTVVDSAEIVHGTFKMSGAVDSVMMVMMYKDNEPISPLVLEDGDISFNLSFCEVEMGGTPLNDKLNDFIVAKRKYDSHISRLDTKLAQDIMDGASYDTAKSGIEPECGHLTDEFDGYVKNFIEQNFDNVLAMGVYTLICYSTPPECRPKSFDSIMAEAPQSFRDAP